MAQEPVVIPEKIYFKIGEVCELLDVQAHVLRYWETEFSMLSPQKNKSGQRSYRRRDVEIALRIKQLLYNEMFTIAGARKKLQQEIKDGFRPRSERREEVIVTPTPAVVSHTVVEPARNSAPMLFDAGFKRSEPVLEPPLPFDIPPVFDGDQHEAINSLAQNLLSTTEATVTRPTSLRW